jgi:hypothetical protein
VVLRHVLRQGHDLGDVHHLRRHLLTVVDLHQRELHPSLQPRVRAPGTAVYAPVVGSGITMLQRIGTGLVLALVEMKICRLSVASRRWSPVLDNIININK